MKTRLESQLHDFATHVRRQDASTPPDGIEQRRMAIYRRLVRNNLHALLSTNFPVIRKTLPEAHWQGLIEGFLSGFSPSSPLFTRIGAEFVDYLQQRAPQGIDPPWLPELAHYEWAELALQIDDSVAPPHDADGDLLTGRPLRSPFAWPLAYEWPVHRIGPSHQPLVAPAVPSLLLLRRDANGDIRFSELSPLVYRLLQLLDDEDECSGSDVLQKLSTEAEATDAEAFLQAGHAMLLRLRDEGTVLGIRIDTV